MKCLEPVVDVGDVVNCCDLVSLRNGELAGLRFPISSDALDDETEINGTDEVGTEGKLLVVGGESGWLVFVNLYLRKAIYRCKLDSAVNVVRFFDKKNVLVGTESGVLSSYDITRSENPTVICHDSNSSIQSLLALPIGFIIGRMDGSCVFYPVKDGCFPHDKSRRVVLSGADVDPINSIVSDGEFVYTAGRDGIIRKYLISNLTV